MTPTKERLVDRVVEAGTTSATETSARDSSEGISDRPARWMRLLLVAWLAGVGGLMVFEPVPDDPSVPTWSVLVSLSFLTLLGATLVGLAKKRPWALRASTATAGVGVVLAAACAQTGHHAGAWWVVELGVFGVLLGLTQISRREISRTAS